MRSGEGVAVTLVVPTAAPSTSPVPSTSVTTPRQAPPTALPRTGAELLPLLLLAVLLLSVGAALVVAARSRLTPGGNRP